jgi:hypothetical protein
MKYAAAIAPEIRAAGRVKRPTSNSRPPSVSRMPARPYSENSSTAGRGSATGKAKSFLGGSRAHGGRVTST